MGPTMQDPAAYGRERSDDLQRLLEPAERNELHMTSDPTSIRPVEAASAERIVQPSWMPSTGPPGGLERK